MGSRKYSYKTKIKCTLWVVDKNEHSIPYENWFG